MIEAVVLSFLVVLIRVRSIALRTHVDSQGTEWVFGGLFVQYAVIYLAQLRIEFFMQYGPIIFVASFLPTLYGAWLCRNIRGMRWLAVGIALNFIVIAANGGSMPVDLHAAELAGMTRAEIELAKPEYIKHRAATEHTRFWILADIIPLPAPFPRPGVASIGDIVSAIGAFIAIQHVFVPPRKRRVQPA